MKENNFKIGDIVTWVGNNPCTGIITKRCDTFVDSWRLLTVGNYHLRFKDGGDASSCCYVNLRYSTEEEKNQYIKEMKLNYGEIICEGRNSFENILLIYNSNIKLNL